MHLPVKPILGLEQVLKYQNLGSYGGSAIFIENNGLLYSITYICDTSRFIFIFQVILKVDTVFFCYIAVAFILEMGEKYWLKHCDSKAL